MPPKTCRPGLLPIDSSIERKLLINYVFAGELCVVSFSDYRGRSSEITLLLLPGEWQWMV